jgi:two-component system chemotaxis response regulator CheY
MKSILVVDDSRFLRSTMRRMLEAQGFAVSEAENGKKALEHCTSQGPPDAILLDINMPEMDGLECLTALRRNPALQTCLVIMCTTQVEAEQIAQAIAAGANEYIMKPFTEEILADKLRQVGILP